MFCLDACGKLIKHGSLAVKLWDTSDVFVRITQALVTGMAKLLVPQWLFGASFLNCTDWCRFVNDKLESGSVDSLELVWHCLQRVVEFSVFCCFECGDFGIDSICLQTLMNEVSFVQARFNEVQKVAAGSLALTSGTVGG